MKVSPKQYAQALYEATRGISATELRERLEHFVHMLAAKNMLRRADEVVSHFQKYANQVEGVVMVTITSAEPLSDTDRKRIREALAEATGKKIELTETVAPGLIGGVVLRIGDTVIDSSFKTLLENLRNRLAAPAA